MIVRQDIRRRQLPSVSQIEALHKQYAKNSLAYQLVFTHCIIVQSIALSLLDSFDGKLDKELVDKGALIHDIGAYDFISKDGLITSKDYIVHGIRGYAILKKEGFPESLCIFAKYHTGVGLTKADILSEKLPLPVDDYSPSTVEEEIVMYADKFHSKTPRFNSFDSIINFLAKFGEDKPRKFKNFANKFGIPELADIARKYKQKVV